MPRLNIEDRWFDDERRTKLALKVGSMEMADGIALNFWRKAQTWYRVGLLIPTDKFFHSDNAQVFIDVGLAEKQADGIYIMGRNEFFRWLGDRSSAGIKGGKSRQTKGGAHDSKNRPTRTKAVREVNLAVKRGDLVRPDNCEECGVECLPDGHHEDYKKVLDVIWLCKKCHGEKHTKKENAARGKHPETNIHKPRHNEPSTSISTSNKKQHSANVASDDGKKLGKFDLIIQFKDGITDPDVKAVLKFISPQLQRSWFRVYKDAAAIEPMLSEAVGYYTSEAGVSEISEVADWGKKLGGWVRRQPFFKKQFEKISGGAESSTSDRASKIMEGLK